MKRIILPLFSLFLLLPLMSCGGGGGGSDSSDENIQGLRRSTDTAVRIVHGSIDGTPVTLKIGDKVIQTAGYGESTFYMPVESGPTLLTIERARIAAGSPKVINSVLADESEYTVFVTGEILEDEYRVNLIEDQTIAPEKGKALVRFLHGLGDARSVSGQASSGTGPVSLGTATLGAASDWVTLSSGLTTFTFGSSGASSSKAVVLEDGHEYTFLVTGAVDLGVTFVKVFEDLD